MTTEPNPTDKGIMQPDNTHGQMTIDDTTTEATPDHTLDFTSAIWIIHTSMDRQTVI